MTDDSSYQAKMKAFSDRLGHSSAASSAWFEKMVGSWCIGGSQRIPGMELTQIGRQLAAWAATSEIGPAASVLRQIEESLTDDVLEHADAWTFAHEVLDGLYVALSSPSGNANVGWEDTEMALRRHMGDETKMIWIPLASTLPRGSRA